MVRSTDAWNYKSDEIRYLVIVDFTLGEKNRLGHIMMFDEDLMKFHLLQMLYLFFFS